MPCACIIDSGQWKPCIYKPFDPCVQLAPILCNRWTGITGHYVFLLLCILIAWEPFSETDMFVCPSGIPDSIKSLKLRATIPHHNPSSCPKLINSYQLLWRYGSRRAHTDRLTHRCTHTHTRLVIRFTTDIHVRTNNKCKLGYLWPVCMVADFARC